MQREPQVVGRPVPSAAGHGSGSGSDNFSSAREACGKRVFLALATCMEQRCEDPRWRNSAECAHVLQVKRQREESHGR